MAGPTRWCRFRNPEGHVLWGREEGDEIVVLSQDPFHGGRETGRRVRRVEAAVLVPVLPSKVVAVGLNYRAHIAENVSGRAVNVVPDEPVIFLKPSTSVIGPGEPIVYPRGVERLDEEAELGIVIKDRTRNVSRDEAPRHILGYTCVNDVSARDYQKKDTQWTRGKGFDTFCPLGPYVVCGLDPLDLEVAAFVNGERKQHSRTSMMIFDIYDLVSFISRVMTLLPGDVIATGTPEGVSPLKPGDTVSIVIQGVGELFNPVIAG
jgi:2-keto-4-pentenoate hydratase/2-oxohepta-3-ene-1,7-dioic acid hydratase in catechol pathway